MGPWPRFHDRTLLTFGGAAGLKDPNSAMEWFFLRRRGGHTAEKLSLLNGEGLLFFRVPLAEPGATLGLPFGSLPAPRAWPAEPHPTLGARFPPDPVRGQMPSIH